MAALAQFRLPLQDKSNECVQKDGANNEIHKKRKVSAFELLFRKAAKNNGKEKRKLLGKEDQVVLQKPVKEIVAEIETKVVGHKAAPIPKKKVTSTSSARRFKPKNNPTKREHSIVSKPKVNTTKTKPLTWNRIVQNRFRPLPLYAKESLCAK